MSFFVCCGQVPPSGKGSLYIRPLLMGSGPILGLGPSPEYTFIVYASPVGNYFKVSSWPFFLSDNRTIFKLFLYLFYRKVLLL